MVEAEQHRALLTHACWSVYFRGKRNRKGGMVATLGVPLTLTHDWSNLSWGRETNFSLSGPKWMVQFELHVAARDLLVEDTTYNKRDGAGERFGNHWLTAAGTGGKTTLKEIQKYRRSPAFGRDKDDWSIDFALMWMLRLWLLGVRDRHGERKIALMIHHGYGREAFEKDMALFRLFTDDFPNLASF